jgi:hypothetical protein
VTSNERAVIEEKARAANMTISHYLRVAGMGGRVKSTSDQEAVLALMRVNADLGRLGGLLKLWLSSPPNVTFSSKDIRNTLKEIEALQQEMREIASKVHRV